MYASNADAGTWRVAECILSKAIELVVGTVSASQYTCKAGQNSNALFPMLVTELGIVIEVSFIQAINAPPPILVTEFGIVMDVKFVSAKFLHRYSSELQEV